MNFTMLMSIKMPTMVGILTFISRIITSECFKGRIFFQGFSFYELLEFHAQLS